MEAETDYEPTTWEEVRPFAEYLERFLLCWRKSEDRKRGLRDFDILFEIESYWTADAPNESRLYPRLFGE